MGTYSTANVVRSHGRDYRKGAMKHTLTPEQRLAGLERGLAQTRVELALADKMGWGSAPLLEQRVARYLRDIEALQAEIGEAGR